MTQTHSVASLHTSPRLSYDLHIWSVRPFQRSFLNRPGQPDGPGAEECALCGKGWQIVINASDRVLSEDVENEIAALLPGIEYLTELNLEGDATNAAKKLLFSTARRIAKQTHGVVADPQTDGISTPAGVKRFVAPKAEKHFSILNLSWWFLTDVMHPKAGRMSFLGLLEKWVPEALPKRYGEYEPPQHLFANTGKAHLEQFMAKHFDSVMVWYPNRPVTGVHVSCPKPLGPGEQGFRTNLVEVKVESEALAQPGWAENLRNFWRQMTFLLQPIYGEVRTEGGYTRRGAAVMVDAAGIQTSYPWTTRSWFWRGVPRKLGHAVVLGREYQRLWPQFARGAAMENGFAFASTPNWSGHVDLADIIGQAPAGIELLSGEGCGPKQKYPSVWPFAPPFG